jgi:hypothetical protein
LSRRHFASCADEFPRTAQRGLSNESLSDNLRFASYRQRGWNGFRPVKNGAGFRFGSLTSIRL